MGTLLAHIAALADLWISTRGLSSLLALNSVVASAVLVYAATRARYILARPDWPYLGLVAFEILALALSLWAFRQGRVAVISAYIVFGLHACVSVAAVIFVLTFKLKRLI